jgi:hypothetical protein
MNTKLFKNPEIRRNLWLDFSLQRIVAMPLVIGLILFIAYWNGKDSSEYNPETQSFDIVNKGFDYIFLGAVLLFFAIVVAWGSKNASDGIVDEYNNRTWDWQRSHNLSPWEMTLGKLLGTTLYNWYGGAICLGIMLFSWPFLTGNQTELVFTLLTLVITAIACHSLSLILALLAIRKSEGRGKVRNGLYILVVLYGFSSIISPFITGFQKSLLSNQDVLIPQINWFGISISLGLYQFISICFFASWALFALYRNFRTEYQYLNDSFAWIGFLAYLIINQISSNAELIILSEKMNFGFTTSLFISLLYLIYILGFLSYGVILLEPKNFIAWKKFYQALQERDWKGINHHFPLWLLTFLTFCLIVLATIVLWMVGDVVDIGKISFLSSAIKEFGFSDLFIPGILLALPLFMARDFSILLYLHAAPRHKRALGATILYLVVLYLILPLLLFTVDAKSLIFLFLPFGSFASFSWLSALLQLGLILFFLYAKFNKRLQVEAE